jgi:hypothetical protein
VLAALLNCCANHTAPPALPVSSSPACSPTREDRVGVCMGIFQHDAVDRSEVETLVDAFPGQSIDFFGALRARVYDDKVGGGAGSWVQWEVARPVADGGGVSRQAASWLVQLALGQLLLHTALVSRRIPPTWPHPLPSLPTRLACRCASGSRAPAWRTLARS